MSSPDESAERVLEGVLGQKKMTFAEFRAAIYNEHSTYLTDEQIHDLFLRHVVRDQAIPLGTVEEVSEFLEQAIPPEPYKWRGENEDLHMPRQRGLQPAPLPTDQFIQKQYDALQQRLGFEKGPSNPTPQPQRKPLGDVTFGEVAEQFAVKARAALKILRGR